MNDVDALKGIPEFVAAVERGSFSKAARELGVSVSFISRQIDAMERRMGIKLLHRTTRSMNLTPNGRTYYLACSELWAGFKAAQGRILDQVETPKGLIRISSGGEFVSREIGPILADFMLLYPEISLEMVFANRQVDLHEEGFDLAIRFGALKGGNLLARKLVTRKLTLCASPTFLKEFGTPGHPNDLRRFNCLIGNTDRWRFKVDGGVREIQVKGNWRSNDSNPVLVAAACKGLGIAYLPYYSTREGLASGALVTLLDSYMIDDKATWLIYPDRLFMPLRVQLLIDFLCDKCSEIEIA
ncbi:LysR family transcriptional regulator [Sulfidibacter corallicola]|uniref:LysR family transcriptional regulator n=1 Tax=Sulfidibacter corallicola TaxID=2818388 RepID=A0A8A4TIK9_SULCO|nr:LysR family transcriptional regulator [Sulfidibacter corallicola]QTD49024.1 LysR family transcriptional regulator [Sulfidibacter corallicola]